MQGPSDDTTPAFWHMIWQYDVRWVQGPSDDTYYKYLNYLELPKCGNFHLMDFPYFYTTKSAVSSMKNCANAGCFVWLQYPLWRIVLMLAALADSSFLC